MQELKDGSLQFKKITTSTKTTTKKKIYLMPMITKRKKKFELKNLIERII